MPAAYVAGRMANLKGEQAYIDTTFIHFSGFSDAVNGTWSKELCQTFDLDMDKLPRIVDPWEVIGEVSDQAARDFGLARGTIIAAGAGDTAANALGAGIVQPGMVLDVAGTAAVLAGCTDTYTSDVKHRALLTMRSVIPGLWNPLAYIAGGGIALRWFRDQFYNTHRAISESMTSDLYEEMALLAEKIPPGADNLFFSPHLGGRICPSSPAMRGAWIGFSWTHTQAHFLRAILESVAFEYAYYLAILKEQLPGLKLIEARATGGGARSPVWNQIKADVLNVPYQRLIGSEFGTWGCALIAGKAAGLYNDLASRAAESAHPSGEPVRPRLENHQIYKPLLKKYIEMEGSLSHFFSA
jgi:xylulokinase